MQDALLQEFDCCGDATCTLIEDLRSFIEVTPRLPDLASKKLAGTKPAVELDPGMERAEVIESLRTQRKHSSMVDMAFYAYRDMQECTWEPFMRAAFERNPVCIEGCADLDDAGVIETLRNMTSESIYTEQRLAQPDEVWNFQRGDGVERALCLAVVLKQRHPEQHMELIVDPEHAVLRMGNDEVVFSSSKGLNHSSAV